MEHRFLTNDCTVKMNKSLKNREQVIVELEVERSLMHQVLPLEEYPPGTHFKVTMEPLEPDTYKPA